MPAVVKSKVGSPWGTREEPGMTLCPFSSKNFKKAVLISSLFTYQTPNTDVPLTYL
jgi:hypothetical protein